MITGYYDYDDEYYRGFIRKANGKVSSFDGSDGQGIPFTEALGINRKGAIVGAFQTPDYVTHGFLRTP